MKKIKFQGYSFPWRLHSTSIAPRSRDFSSTVTRRSYAIFSSGSFCVCVCLKMQFFSGHP